ncbi:MAG: short-chain dehydrogenase [Clostridiales bacterium GWF2_38_85]|nr:MAG: short-chain dehydrogenase [Clostridiales bacterium GWF2_38_85]
MGKVAVITGGSSGIGLCTAKALLQKGCTVYELSRRDNEVKGINHIKTDITDIGMVNDAIRWIIKKEKRIDVLINNAGWGISGAVEFTETDEAKKLMDINFFGAVNTVKAVLPHMREAGSGRIVNLSSVAAQLPIPFQTYYSVSKAAVNSYTMALVNEVKPFGVSVCAVMPGDIKTGFTQARKKLHDGDGIYNGRISRSVSIMEKDEQNGMAPEVAGEFISRIALKNKVKPIYTIGLQYKIFVVLAKILPYGLVNKIVGMLYAK